MPYTVLAVDDDAVQLKLIAAACSNIHHAEIELLQASTLTEGLELCNRRSADLVLADHSLPDGSGMVLVDRMRSLNPEIPVVIMTAYETVEHAVESFRRGADDYLVKPFQGNDIERVILRSMQRRHEQREVDALQAALDPDQKTPVLLHSLSDSMRSILSVLGRAANGNATVLIEGESGTGKEVLARALHQAGRRKDGPFVAVNCAALPESLIEAELFGAKKGAYTGAVADRRGRFEEANGGTLFIDEVGEIPPAVQVKLLRTLQSRQIERVGTNTPVAFDARIIAATNRSLRAMVESGRFREDLYYRLNVIGIQVPALRDRKEDIPLLLDTFLQSFAEANGKDIKGISAEARQCFMRYNYPGNIRELENIVESVVVLSRGSIIRRADLPSYMRCDSGVSATGCADNDPRCEDDDNVLDARLRDYERELIRDALERSQGNQSLAARFLGIGERRLRSRLERLRLRSNSVRRPSHST